MSDFDATDLDMIRRGDMLGPKLGQRVYDALSRPLNDTGTVKGDWRCAKCGCHSYARVDRLSDSGKVAFEPGDNVRCVNCKDVSFFPALVPSPPSGEVAEGFVPSAKAALLALHKRVLTKKRDHIFVIQGGDFNEFTEALLNGAIAIERLAPTPQPDSQGDGWQDISSAPRNGEEFLAADFSGALGDNFQQVVSWTEWTDSAGRQCAGWDIADGATRPPSCFTHWRPLPAPPALQQGA